ncbi:DUF2750 domain-containing protein [Marinomonas sp. 15G1-11]|uniref:DUF2750 domain-containing protein n=1 Tax=Marinomonas phaeophyticola TaxID=3004091 RepID=A0ABT4JQQ6_9GAMM|nr:DUF2750 domain-containing protein [Marinomonas sp. 15G1-11]MCZ2720715.1 DUF2750 domain-containing protein [Marinomonas sp. 15G1-11]
MSFDDQQVETFFRLQSNTRYDEVVNHCKKKQDVWVLQDDQGCLIIELGSEKVLPIWNDSSLAEQWKGKEYEGFSASVIAFADFSSKWLPGMVRDGFKLGIAPNLAGEGIVVATAEFARDIGVDLTTESH